MPGPRAVLKRLIYKYGENWDEADYDAAVEASQSRGTILELTRRQKYHDEYMDDPNHSCPTEWGGCPK